MRPQWHVRNLISRDGPSGPTTYTWDAQNRLVGISGSNGTASFKYDAMGRRIEKTVNGQTTGFLYDGAQAIAELQGNAISTAYHTGLAIDEVLARYAGSGNKTLLTDALQSVIAQADDTGQIQNYYAYTPYGEVLTLGPDDGNPIQYTGRENDGTGLYYYRARYYHPGFQRFISEDPAGIAAGVNLYAFVNGDPVSNTDPTGEFVPILAGAVVGAISGGAAAWAGGGSTAQIVAGVLWGGATGAAFGALAPLIFPAAATGLGAAVISRTGSALIGNVLGQLQNVNNPCFQFNVPGFIAAGVAGGFAGAWSAVSGWGLAPTSFLGRVAMGVPPGLAQAAGAAVTRQQSCSCP